MDAMKLNKLVKEFDELLESIDRQRQTHEEKRRTYLRMARKNEKVLRRQLKDADEKDDRKRLKRDLLAVKKAQALLRPNCSPSVAT